MLCKDSWRAKVWQGQSQALSQKVLLASRNIRHSVWLMHRPVASFFVTLKADHAPNPTRNSEISSPSSWTINVGFGRSVACEPERETHGRICKREPGRRERRNQLTLEILQRFAPNRKKPQLLYKISLSRSLSRKTLYYSSK